VLCAGDTTHTTDVTDIMTLSSCDGRLYRHSVQVLCAVDTTHTTDLTDITPFASVRR